MKYLVFLIALLLSTPSFAEEGQPTIEGIMMPKPVVCGDGVAIYNTITNHTGEVPFASWTTEEAGTRSSLLINKKKKTMTVLEYMPTGGVACIVSVGTNLEITDFVEKIRGTPISYLTK